jgi:hypothetical protein
MYHTRFDFAKDTCLVFVALLSFTVFVPLSAAQFRVTDNFNRPDGAPGLGWSQWGNGAQISGNQLETFGQINVAGGIERTLDVTFPVSFSFDFSTNTPSDGGWLIAFNAVSAVAQGSQFNGEVELFQYRGGAALCTDVQTSGGPLSQCFSTVSGQRDFTAKAHVSGTLNPNFSATVTIKYNDGLSPATVTLKATAPVGAIQKPTGSIFFFGNSNASNGPHFFDNFSLSLR